MDIFLHRNRVKYMSISVFDTTVNRGGITIKYGAYIGSFIIDSQKYLIYLNIYITVYHIYIISILFYNLFNRYFSRFYYHNLLTKYISRIVVG